MEVITLGNLAPALREQLAQFAQRIRDLAGDNLLGISIFGSLLAGAPPGGRHVVKSVVVLREINLELLHQLAPSGERYGKLGIAAPLVMTPDYIRQSLDTFPLELMEIAHHRHTLYGADHFAELPIQDVDVRRECERELKTVQIGMHQGVLSTAGHDELIDDLEQHMAATLARVLRGLLWLAHRREARSEQELVEHAETLTGSRLNGLRNALEPGATHDWPQLCRLYDDVGALRRYVDAL